jgi:hypothetical protein
MKWRPTSFQPSHGWASIAAARRFRADAKKAAIGAITPFIAAPSDGLGATGLATGRRFARANAAPA